MLQNAADSNVNSSTVYEHRREQKMSDEWNWGQEPEKTDGSSQQPENTDESGSAASDQTAAPEDELNENVTYHYRYTSSRNSDGAGSTDNGNYYASSNNSDTSGNSSKDSGFESQSSEPRYAHYQVDEQEKKPEEKKKGRHHRLHNDKAASSGFGRKAGNTITLAVIFGLVAGLVFQAVNMVSDKYFKKETQTAVGSAETLTSSASASTTAEESTDAGEGINAEIVANEKRSRCRGCPGCNALSRGNHFSKHAGNSQLFRLWNGISQYRKRFWYYCRRE